MLKKITYQDKDWILKIRNQASVRKGSFNSKAILRKENDAFWKVKRNAYAIIDNDIPVGVIIINEANVVSIYLDEASRNKGLAYAHLKKLNLKGCTADIKPGNASSLKLFKKLGFVQERITFVKK